MSDLITFLRAALDEDEQAARAAIEPASMYPWGDVSLPQRTVADVPDDVRGYLGGTWGEHFARHDPARVLADVAAKRAILELHRFGRRTVYGEYSESGALVVGDVTTSCQLCCDFSGDQGTGACRTVQHLAQAYGWEGP